MSSARRVAPIDHELVSLYRPFVAAPNREAFREFAIVALRNPARTFDGVPILPGATGTIVTVWDEGAAYDVEFTDPAGLASVSGEDIEPA